MVSPLQELPAGEIGEICVRGPAVIQSYEGNAGQESFQDGWLRTGDLGYLDEEGYLFIRGRQREVINRGGENIAPREVEEVIQAFPLVQEAAAVGRPDALYGEQVVAYLTVRERWSEEHLLRLRQHLRRHLSTPQLPVDLIILDALPRNATGKIDRRLLRACEQARAAEQHEELV
jgi:acyl-CoA synthetase (AMP-forming)/AMP-acid ligase II